MSKTERPDHWRHRDMEICGVCREPWPCSGFKQWYLDRGLDFPQ